MIATMIIITMIIKILLLLSFGAGSSAITYGSGVGSTTTSYYYGSSYYTAGCGYISLTSLAIYKLILF